MNLKRIQTEQNPHNLPTYKNNRRIKDHDVEFEWTQWELKEYAKCAKDPAYFARTYVKINNIDGGLELFDLYPYQEKMYELVNENRFSIVLAPRQSGKSIAFVVYLLWYAIFKADKNVAILANKEKTAKQLLRRIALALENLPFFLQPGCKTLNKLEIEFSNNSRLFASATSSDSIRGESVNLLYLDEFAFVDNDEEFYTSTYPVITGGKTSKVIITSTANGVGNVFYSIWRKSQQKKNSYASFKVRWQDVPGRDEKWKEETISNTSQRQFSQEYGCTFLGSGKTLIDEKTLLTLEGIDPMMFNNIISIYEKPRRGRTYVLTADVAEGGGDDSSAFSITDITERPFVQVAAYQNDRISPYLYGETIVRYAKMYNNAYVCIESNDQGGVVNYSVFSDLEYDNLYVESWVKKDKLGLKTTAKTKRIGCSNLKDLIETGQYVVNDKNTVEEICTFEAKGTSYEAANGNNDDLVMSLVLFSFLASTERFKNEFEIDLKKTLYSAEAVKQLQDAEIPPFGIIDDGQEIYEEILFDSRRSKMSRKERFEENVRFKKDDIFGVTLDILDELDPHNGSNFLF